MSLAPGLHPADTEERWLRRLRPAGPPAPLLVAFPHAGGAASAFYGLAAVLGDDVDLRAVQYPGRQDRRGEPFAEDLTELADVVAGVLLRSGRRPAALLGHSMGAVVAFEVARRLEAAAAGPARLFVSGSRPPGGRSEDLGPPAQDEDLADAVAQLSGTDPRLLRDPEVMALLLPGIRADLTALARYRGDPQARVEAPIAAFAGREDSLAPPGVVAAWAEHTRAGFALRTFDGGHFFLDAAEGGAGLADAVRRALVRDRDGSAGSPAGPAR